MGWTQTSRALHKPKYTAFPPVDVDISSIAPPATFPVACSRGVLLRNLSPPLLIPQPPAVIGGRVLGDGGSDNRAANSPAHSSSCPHFKTSRRPSSADPDLNPALLRYPQKNATVYYPACTGCGRRRNRYARLDKRGM